MKKKTSRGMVEFTIKVEIGANWPHPPQSAEEVVERDKLHKWIQHQAKGYTDLIRNNFNLMLAGQKFWKN